MGNEIIYNDQSIGDIAKRRWLALRELLKVLLTYINTIMDDNWRSGRAINIVVSAQGTVPPELPPVDESPPRSGQFYLDSILDDRSDQLDEIVMLDPEELYRLFEWCEYLSRRDGAFELFAPAIRALREKTASLAHLVRQGSP